MSKLDRFLDELLWICIALVPIVFVGTCATGIAYAILFR